MKNFWVKIDGGLKLFIVVVIVYLISAAFDIQLIINSLQSFWNLLVSIVPFLLLVVLIMFISNLFITSKRIAKIIGHESGIKGFIVSIVFGILSTGPVYMWYPLLSDLRDKGVKNSHIVTFLYNRAVKIPLLPMLIYYFGLAFVVILSVYMIIFSVINGILVDRILLTQKK